MYCATDTDSRRIDCDDARIAVERSRWTDDRLDNLAERVMRHDVLEVRIDALERSLFEFRAEMREFRAEMLSELRDVRADLGGQVSSLRGEFYSNKRWMMTLWITAVLAILAVLVELSIRT
jgi:hypothetical protein